jgi:hypothetical protein
VFDSYEFFYLVEIVGDHDELGEAELREDE